MIDQLGAMLDEVKKIGKVILSFSRGIDSAAAWIVLRDVCTVKPVYFQRYPELLAFEAEDIARFENHFQTEIAIVLDPNAAALLYSWIWQDIDGRSAIEPDARTLRNYARTDYDTLIRAVAGDLYIAKGLSIFDSPQRRAHLRQTGMLYEPRRLIYPVAHMTRNERRRLVEKAGAPLATEYEILTHTCDTMLVDHLDYIRAHQPEDFARLKFWYPFLEAEIKRYEYSHA